MNPKKAMPVLFVCTGTHDHHVGDAPDRRAAEHAHQCGYDIAALRARQVVRGDCETFDLVLAMDRGHLRFMERLCALEHQHKLKLFLDIAGLVEADVPDPYYSRPERFEQVLNMVEAASRGLLGHVRFHLSRVST